MRRVTNPADPRAVWKDDEKNVVRVSRQLLRELAGLVLLLVGAAGMTTVTFGFDTRLGWAWLSGLAIAAGARLSRSRS